MILPNSITADSNEKTEERKPARYCLVAWSAIVNAGAFNSGI